MRKLLCLFLVSLSSLVNATEIENFEMGTEEGLIASWANSEILNTLKSQGSHSELDILNIDRSVCNVPPIPGGWVSFPLGCRHFEGTLEVALDKNFKRVIVKFPIYQDGWFEVNEKGEMEYYFALTLAGKTLKKEKVVFSNDRTYEIGKKINGLCVEEETRFGESVVCRAGFNGIHERIIAGYEEIYHGEDYSEIFLLGAPSLNGKKPLLPWRATLTLK